MVKIFSILLSGLIFFQGFSMNFQDFSKFKIMVEHLDFHQENFNESVMDFVSIHYGSNKILHSNEHEHNDEHENLPFKKDSKTSENIPIVYVINNSSIKINNNNLSELSVNFFYKEMHSTFEKPNVFQPPRHS